MTRSIVGLVWQNLREIPDVAGESHAERLDRDGELLASVRHRVQSTLRASMDDRVTTVEYAEVAAALSRANSYPSAQARTAAYREEVRFRERRGRRGGLLLNQ